MKHTLFILFILLGGIFTSCKHGEKEKTFDAQEHVINVKDKVVEINTAPVDISRISAPYILNEYLLIGDHFSLDKLIYIFDKNTFEYITSIGEKGQGPTEIANMGRIVSNEKERTFYVVDNGKQKVLDYPIDSVLINPLYVPEEKAAINKREFPYTFQYVNDTLSYALLIKETADRTNYMPVVSRWNMQTGEVVYLGDGGHPQIKKKRASFDASVEHGIFVEVYWHNELMSINAIDGQLKCYVYGKNWNDENSNRYLFFNQVLICKDKIVASYSGDVNIIEGKHGPEAVDPTKLILFNIEGDYISTLELGYSITGFCYDVENNRLIFEFDDEIQFGYLDMSAFI